MVKINARHLGLHDCYYLYSVSKVFLDFIVEIRVFGQLKLSQDG